MKIFIICCLLFIHVNMCIYICGFRVSIRVSGIRGFGFGDGFPPESVFGADSGFDFGFRFWVHGDSTRSEPDPLPSLYGSQSQAKKNFHNPNTFIAPSQRIKVQLGCCRHRYKYALNLVLCFHGLRHDGVQQDHIQLLQQDRARHLG